MAAHPEPQQTPTRHIAIVGAGPAGLMAAEVINEQAKALGLAISITVYDAMPSAGRKFLMAGKSGLNLTHAEEKTAFVSRYGGQQAWVSHWLEAFDADALRDWCSGLGIETFVGSSGRVFPKAMKAAPLLRAWLHRLRTAGVRFQMRHRWLGWGDGQAQTLRFATPDGEISVTADAVVLALGGASWPQLGSDGQGVALLAARGVEIAPFRPANCGFEVAWSEVFRQRFAGEPVKSVAVRVSSPVDSPAKHGDFVISRYGIEGSLIYAVSAALRDHWLAAGETPVPLYLDLLPGKTQAAIAKALAQPRGRDSLTNHWRRKLGLTGVKAGLLRECLPAEVLENAGTVATALKHLPLPLQRPRPLAEAISSAGGICRNALSAQLMLNTHPGVFCAGEMLDWEAPTGGYLLTACMASGRVAGAGVVAWLHSGIKPVVQAA